MGQYAAASTLWTTSRRNLMIMALGMSLVALARPGVAEDPTVEPTPPVVKLVVDYGDGVQKHFDQLAWRDGATVFDLMQQAANHPRGIRFTHRGKGATILVAQIDDVKNEGGSGAGRNWIYRLNGEVGDRSVGICPVEPGDTVLWRFETYR